MSVCLLVCLCLRCFGAAAPILPAQQQQQLRPCETPTERVEDPNHCSEPQDQLLSPERELDADAKAPGGRHNRPTEPDDKPTRHHTPATEKPTTNHQATPPKPLPLQGLWEFPITLY